MSSTGEQSRYRGAMIGLAVGDAIGTTVEFKAPGSFEPLTDMVGGGPFGLPVGAWTDDTSMALCLAESLIECQGFDPVDQLERYVAWWREGHLSSVGRCFDIGGATSAALGRFERARQPFPGDADTEAAGNGALMRLAPVPLAFAHDAALAVELAGESARTTHGSRRAIDANRYFAALLIGALRGNGIRELLHDGIYSPVEGLWDREPLHPEVAKVAIGSFLAKQPPAIRGAGYVVATLEAALWALASTATFAEGVLAAANLGDDADTTAAIYGQLAGACYGVEAIPARWREKLVMADVIREAADGLWELAARSPRSRSRPDSNPPPGDSYWVIPGRLLAGPYPGAPSKDAARAKLEQFLDAGVTYFVDLTEENEPLEPYKGLLQRVARARGIRATHVRLPVRDVDVPSTRQMRATLATIRLALDAGERVYVHCWGGVGRTGTVIGCLLVENGAEPADVLSDLARLRERTVRASRIAPETPAQREFVTTWGKQDGVEEI